MHWTEFQERAKRVHSGFFFKRTSDGYEVWDIAQITGSGMPRKYKCMVIPFGTNSCGFSMMLKKLKRGNWNRRLALQHKITMDAIARNEMLKILKRQKIEAIAVQAAKSFRKTFKKAASDLNVSEHAMRNAMKGIMWDDTKKELRKQMEARGAYQ